MSELRLQGLPPVFDARARVLVLGSFPGVASLRAAQYYAHPRNAFWPVMEALLSETGLAARPYAERLEVLRDHGVALWDAVASCERTGSLDAAITEAAPSDLAALQRQLPALRVIACNGALAHRETLAVQRLRGNPGLPLLRLPSTSPAHASLGLAHKIDQWLRALAPYLCNGPGG